MLAFAVAPAKAPSPRADVRAAFERYDRNRSGFLDYRELRNALTYMGLDVSTAATVDLLRAYDDYPDGKLDVHEFETLVLDLKSASAAPAVAGVGYLDAQEWDTSTGMPRPAWQYEPAHASRPRSAPARRIPEGSVDYYGPTPVSELRRQQQVYDEEVAARQAEYYAETVDFMQTLRGVSPKVVLG